MKIRCFLAIPLPKNLLAELERFQARFRTNSGGVRWVDAKIIHLTIKFLGELETGKIDPLLAVVSKAASKVTAFPLKVEKLGVFPSATHPRIFWAGVSEVQEGNSALMDTVTRIEDGCRSIGLALELRPFHPHLTLGRSKEGNPNPRTIETWLSEAEAFYAGSFHAEKIVLYRSILHPSGPEYRPMHSFPFSV